MRGLVENMVTAAWALALSATPVYFLVVLADGRPW